ncbi:hypothetical protein D3C81_1052590 [compost metagenome]
MRRAGHAGHAGRGHPRRHHRVLPRPARQRDRAEGRGRRWWARHAHRAGGAGARGSLRALPFRGAQRLRRGPDLRGTAGGTRAPHRSTDRWRWARRGGAGRARLHAAAALPEAGRDRAEPGTHGGPARAYPPCRHGDGARGGLPQPWDVRVPRGDHGGRRAARLRLYRSQPASPGGAHDHRAGDRRGSGGDAACPCPGALAARGGARPAGAAGTARLCHPAADQCRGHRRPGFRAARAGPARALRSAQRPGRARGYPRLYRLCPAARL